MDKLESMRTFVEVVNHSGFAAAGRHLGLSRSVVNKLVAQLEQDLDVQLLQRTTRRVSPTDMGRAYYERCVDILAEVKAAELSVTQMQMQPKGTLRINAPMSFGTMHLAEAIAQFMYQYPDIKVQMTLSDRFVDLIEEGFDVTLRIAAAVEEEALITHKIAPIRRVLCAAPNYLKAHGTPTRLEDLKQHHCLHYGHLATGSKWRLVGPDKTYTIPIKCRGYSNNGEVLRESAIAGVGIALLPTFIIGDALRSNELSIILPNYRPLELTARLCYATNRHLSTKIQLLTTFLQDWFKQPSWERGG
ncbi:LysR substrate binding domain protein [Synechococcus sp. PCC 7335]|uniref:LysR family transcriptional regulator n=1 Tax=Synechococcus sp. (strain ATCC 29403 / PCC 7335) TaxID=91464 RepID=UPI00017EBBCB|nr:LysR family transcriptional regulator [Synechococcus sp. PCC 7335]EDX85357.1 LysR substrate binding domain protein [Synechococcus sp. PCC 7335]